MLYGLSEWYHAMDACINGNLSEWYHTMGVCAIGEMVYSMVVSYNGRMYHSLKSYGFIFYCFISFIQDALI